MFPILFLLLSIGINLIMLLSTLFYLKNNQLFAKPNNYFSFLENILYVILRTPCSPGFPPSPLSFFLYVPTPTSLLLWHHACISSILRNTHFPRGRNKKSLFSTTQNNFLLHHLVYLYYLRHIYFVSYCLIFLAPKRLS